uniref:Tyrosine-protein kinase ephrin type A/B receptor-like domain-containing protein n=2 Tax=Panagrolaimus sp. ES5 TaxID=591445 RepID=A0AC34GQJ1_9BILA
MSRMSPRSGWIIQSGEIRYQPTACISKLSISLHLVQTGYIEFYYKMPKNSRGLVSTVDVRNEQCQSYGSQLAALFRKDEDDMTANADWKIKRLDLKRGQNLITWTIANNRELTTLADIIYVAKIDVVGLPYTSSCSKCPSGTFSSSKGNSLCQPCGANYYSKTGATSCARCPENQYSDTKSTTCIPKPVCEKFDFYPVYGRCQDNKQTIDYTPIQPAVCQDTLPNSYNKPSTEHSHKCHQCSPGTERTPDGVCEFCAEGLHSNGTKCERCPPKMRPNYGYYITNWEKLPIIADTSCEYATFEENKECRIKPSWIPLGDRIESATSRDNGIAMEISFNVTSGFYNPIMQENSKLSLDNPVATVSLDAETICLDESCTLYIVQEIIDKGRFFRFLGVYNGSLSRQILSYPIFHNGNSRFIIAFMRSGAATGNDAISDKAIIYSVNMTNVGDAQHKLPKGGADSCLPCPSMDNTGGCHPCPAGHYIDSKQNLCIKCPLGTKLNRTSNQIGQESCIKCGINMESLDGVECAFSGKLELPDSSEPSSKPMRFDLSPLKNKPLIAEGIKVFAREGNSYFHSFNVSLFGEGVKCNEKSDQSFVFAKVMDEKPNEEGEVLFCRSTAVPLNNENQTEKAVYVSSFVIGRKLASVTRDRSFKGFNLSDKDLEYDTMTQERRPIDVHFYFEPLPSHVRSCSNGTIGIVTTRCEPTATNEPQVRLPRSCPDGTCNGCMFHIIVETSHACPVCDTTDFQEIRGECINGKQQVHYIPSKHCVLSGAQSKEKTETCTSSNGLKLLLILATILIGFLILIIFVFYQRNRSLEYRYSRIVEGHEPEEMETCGLESDDEDLDDDDSNNARVYFGRKKNDYVVGVTKTGVPNFANGIKKSGNSSGGTAEEAKFLSDETESV